jgi:hypothetical protein
MTLSFGSNIILNPANARKNSLFTPPEISPKDSYGVKDLTGYVRAYVKWFLDTYEGLEERLPGPDWGAMWGYLLPVVGKEAGSPLFLEDSEDTSFPSPEETAAMLLRRGIPRSAVKAERNAVTISLDGVLVRIYRYTSGYPAGSVRILRPGQSRVFRLALTSGELAELILSLNEAAAGIRREMDELDKGMKAADRKLAARKKADEIAVLTVRRLLDSASLPKGVTCSYTVTDGVVSLTFRKTMTASAEVPLQKLSELLRDPQGIESSLRPEDPPEDDCAMPRKGSFGKTIWSI